MMKRGRQAIARLVALMMVLPAGAVPSAMTTPRPSANVLWRPLPLDAVLRGRTAPRVQYIPTTAPRSAMKPIVDRLQQPRLEANPPGGSNPIVVENSLPGSLPSEWDLDPIDGLGGLGGDRSLQGYAEPFSVNLGASVDFKVDTVYTAYTIDIYRMGYYQGNGARKVATIAASAITPRMQPDCPPDTTTGLIDCSNWAISTTWQVPANAVSGIYFAKIEEVGNFHAR